MERSNRPKNQDKWRRIIQPAGDSDSSDWSSTDSDIGGVLNDYRCCKAMADTPASPVSEDNGESPTLVRPKTENSPHQISFFRLRSQNDKDIKPSTSSVLHHDFAERSGGEQFASSADRFWQYARNKLTSLRDSSYYGTAMPSSSSATGSATAEGLDCWNEYIVQRRTPPPPPFRKRFVVAFTGDNNNTNQFTFTGSKNIQDNLPSTSSDVQQQGSKVRNKWLVPKKASALGLKRSCSATGSESQLNEDSSDVQIVSILGGASSSSTAVRNGPPPVKKVRWSQPEVQENPPQCMYETPAATSSVEIINLEESVAGPTIPEQVNNTASDEKTDIASQSCGEEQQAGPRAEDDELLNQGIIGLLECPVCMDYMGPPIHQCRRGHLICSNCKSQLTTCPTCRARFSEQRNLAMEKVAEKLYYPCKNVHMGCTHTLCLGEREEHESNCKHRNYRCAIVPPCDWRGQQQEILAHIRMTHSETLLFGAEHELKMLLGDFSEQTSQNWVVSAFGKLFRVNLGAVRGGRVQVFGCVIFLGPSYQASHFNYTLTVGPNAEDSAKRSLTFSRATHRYAEKCADYYSTGDCFHLRTESAQLFCVGPCNMLQVKLKIHRMNNE